ncbi:DUF3253 domain-containing protein [Actinophytocola oryzae]|uniref:Uncharacterized protein DUF3253 n=1 Tax=Actinophytocola oryzae TaxID=502181 RepID=A0A4R7W149_9PSEU|nr:DUF3253 domain-containing protein [Actinophytocola oryzae]TDV56260.1 uncharacterized protein DUF3253 [Actinophytocola oryzae]
MADQGVARLRAELAAAGVKRLEGSTGDRLEVVILALARHRGPDSSICPSDAARAVGGAGWRDLMPDAREAARALARQHRVRVTSRGDVLSPDGEWTGPVRISVDPR